MTDVDATVVAALAGPVAGAMPMLMARGPGAFAVELGRIGVPSSMTAWPTSAMDDGAVAARLRAGPGHPDGADSPAASPVTRVVRLVGSPLTDLILDRLEPVVLSLDLDLTGVPDLSGYLGQPPTGLVALAWAGGDSAALTAVRALEQLRPGAADLAASLTRQLAGHPLIVPLLAVPSHIADEAWIAMRHGTAYLALATVVASAVIGRWVPPGGAGSEVAALVGVAIGVAVLLLRDAPMPARYAAALLERVRKEQGPRRWNSGMVPVTGHRFALVEGEIPESADFAANGLVTVVPGGAVIRTGIAAGSVAVLLITTDEPPPPELASWDEIVEVSWHAEFGLASVTGPDAAGEPQLCHATPPWPGDYRLRVHANGRDDADAEEKDADAEEKYELVVWPAPAAPAIVHKLTDQLGHRLRGEPVPDRPVLPERAYRWVERTALNEAATITVVTGSTAADVLRAFGADPDRPESLRGISDDVLERMADDPWVAVLDTGAAVLAVEYNGWQGTDEGVLSRASAGGRAASWFWNVNALTCLSFAEGGRVLASFEPLAEDVDAEPSVAAALDGLDFDDCRDTIGEGLIAVQRFTGHGITAEDLDRIEAADIAFRIGPSPA